MPRSDIASWPNAFYQRYVSRLGGQGTDFAPFASVLAPSGQANLLVKVMPCNFLDRHVFDDGNVLSFSLPFQALEVKILPETQDWWFEVAVEYPQPVNFDWEGPASPGDHPVWDMDSAPNVSLTRSEGDLVALQNYMMIFKLTYSADLHECDLR